MKIAPPDGLGQPEKDIWTKLQADYSIVDEPGLILLAQLTRCLKVIREGHENVSRDGMMVAAKPHPLLGAIRDAEKQVAATIRQLNFDLEPKKAVGRPPGSFSVVGGKK